MQRDDINQELYKLIDLIKIEQKEELEDFRIKFIETPLNQRKVQGITWYPLNINSIDTSFNQKIVIEFEKTNNQDKNHLFQSGKTVSLFTNQEDIKANKNIIGSVINVKNDKIKVLFNISEIPDWLEEGKIGLDLYYDEKTFKEMDFSLNYVINTDDKRINYLKEIFYGVNKAKFDKSRINNYKKNKDYDKLNQSQKNAIDKVLESEDICIIHGPPGTGKTTTLVNTIETVLSYEKQVLVVAPSNTAVDLIAQLLSQKDLNIVRIGNPAKVDIENLKITFDSKVENHLLYQELKKMYKEADKIRSQALKFKRSFGKEERENRKSLLNESKALINDAKRIEKIINQDILDSAQVICSTFVGATEENLRAKKFSTVFIDEAAQSLEPACWIVIKKADKVVLAGDHKQLPPTIKSDLALKKGLGITLFEKCIEIQKESSILLDTQYRMNENIMNFSNKELYNSKLIAHDSVKTHLLFNDDKAILFIDTAGCGFNEILNPKTKSYYNPEEINILINHLNLYLPQIEETVSIGIISPYKEQVNEIEKAIDKNNYPNAKIFIDTVDGFQGQEKDIIYISLVRSNENSEIGFLSDIRRMNVAMTRARKKLIIIGDSATISENKFYSNFLEYIDLVDSYESAWSLM
ncbi:MAG: AAA domain-containing protein [Candidatus Sericytochromatia bacterium]